MNEPYALSNVVSTEVSGTTPVAAPLGNTPWVPSLVAAFLSARNEKTLSAYRHDLKDFQRFLGASSLDDAARHLLSRGQGPANGLALAYKAHLLERGLQPATVNRRMASLRSLVKLARMLGIVPWTLEVESVAARAYRDTRGPGAGGVRLLLKVAEGSQDPKGVRDRAILRLLFDLGLRRGEVVSLDLADLNLEGGTVAVLGKGRRERERLTLPEPTKVALRAWLQVRGQEAGPVFINFDPSGKAGCRLTGGSVWRMVRAYGKKVGLEVRPHGLRHAAITQALDMTGGNLRSVQRFSRHRDVRVLQTYDDNRTDLGGEVARLVSSAAS